MLPSLLPLGGWWKFVRVGRRRDRIGKIVTTAIAERRYCPVLLDELEDRDVISIGVHHAAAGGIGGNHDERNAGAIAEEIDGLDVARIPVAATLVKGDKDGGVGPKFRLGLPLGDNLADECFEDVDLRTYRMAVIQTARVDKRDSR